MTAGGDSGSVDLTVSIANRNGREFLRGCIESIRSGTARVRYEVVVVDNASTDGSCEMLRSEFPEVRIVANETPRGYGASHNQAFAVSRGRYFLVLNNDMVVHAGAFDAMFERMERNDGIGVLGCRLHNPDGTLQASCSRESTLLRILVEDLAPQGPFLERLGLQQRMRSWAHDVECDINVVQGSCMFMPRGVFDAVGRFDEQFDFFREEHDLCRRVKASGWRVVFFPGATITHFGGQTMKKIPQAALQAGFDSRYKYFAKHNGPFAATVVLCSAFTGVVLRWLSREAISMLRLARDPKDARIQAAIYRGTVKWFFEPARPWSARERNRLSQWNVERVVTNSGQATPQLVLDRDETEKNH